MSKDLEVTQVVSSPNSGKNDSSGGWGNKKYNTNSERLLTDWTDQLSADSLLTTERMTDRKCLSVKRIKTID